MFAIIDRPDSKTEIHVEVFEGLVQNVYCSDPNVVVNVIDRDVQEEIETEEIKVPAVMNVFEALKIPQPQTAAEYDDP